MSKPETVRRIARTWQVRPKALPLIRRRCLNCSSARYRANGKFRVNANHKLLDVWLLALCTGCGKTIKLTVLERANVRTIDPKSLTRFHDNDITLAAKLLADPRLLRRNGVSLDWSGAWTLHMTNMEMPADDKIEIAVGFAQRIPIRLTVLLSAGLETSRSEVYRLIADGKLSLSRPLPAKPSIGFTFTIHC
ncbi:DUF1062 domain-containing protein [Actinoplanes sp. CA-015351]|uniref:DUF1062 domain-containing protein n=1 Tax=Actinoplanes sp. CA-015351 TaxID=3239897 RepID=UPI003D95B599